MPFVDHEQAVIAACEETHRQQDDYRRCISFVIDTTTYLVKFGDSWCFSPEAMMQTHFTIVAQGDSGAPRVPVVHHTFQHGYLTYAIIEFIETIEVSMDVFVYKVAEAVLWLRRQPVPVSSSALWDLALPRTRYSKTGMRLCPLRAPWPWNAS